MNIFLYHLKNMVSKYFPSSRYICLSAFVFLRFLCPAIFSPEGFNILDTDGFYFLKYFIIYFF